MIMLMTMIKMNMEMVMGGKSMLMMVSIMMVIMTIVMMGMVALRLEGFWCWKIADVTLQDHGRER